MDPSAVPCCSSNPQPHCAQRSSYTPIHGFLFLSKRIHCLLHLSSGKMVLPVSSSFFLGALSILNQSLHRLNAGSAHPLLPCTILSLLAPISGNPARCSLFLPSLSPPEPRGAACSGP